MSRIEVVLPSSPGSPGMGFDFNDARPLPFLSAPTSPRRFGDFTLSAPTSPSRMADFYRSFEDFSIMGDDDDDQNGVPFHWEERPGTPKSPKKLPSFKDEDFAFDFSADLEKDSLPADELFDGGKIRPLKLPPRLLQVDEVKSPLLSSPRSPRSPIEKGKRIIREVLSPRWRKPSDPFESAMDVNGAQKVSNESERGRRDRVSGLNSSSSRRGKARSLSPYRVSQYPWEEDERQQQQQQQPQHLRQQSGGQAELGGLKTSSFSSTTAVAASKSSSKKWRFRDLLLFRSASEGRASDRDAYRKQAAAFGLFKRHDDVKNSSIRSSDSSGSNSGSRRKVPVSAHELHYTTNKAASEGLRKKTFLPYRQGILGRLAFSPSHAR